MKKWESALQMLRFTEDASDGVTTDKSHCLILYALTMMVRPKIAIEIGSRRGGSAIWIARAMEENNFGHLTCIDAFVDRHGGAQGFLPHFHYNIKEMGLDHRITLIHALSTDAVSQASQECELLFIDGDHSYDGCLADIQNYVPRVRSGGALMIHDSLSESGVTRAIKDSENVLSSFFSTEVENRQGVWIGFKI
jgi:predicted O-methyltransferase YrrM